MSLHDLQMPCDQNGLITTAESWICSAPGDDKGTHRRCLCSNLLRPEAKQRGRELEVISSAEVRTILTFFVCTIEKCGFKATLLQSK